LRLVSLAVLMAVPSAGAVAAPHRPAGARTAVSAARPIRLEVVPAQIRLHGPNAAHGLLASAVMPDGTRRDVTGAVALSIDAPRVAELQSTRLLARSDGRATVAVRYGGQTARVPVEVNGSRRPVAVSFRNDVIPLLARLGCSSGTCHGANSGKGGFKLSLRGYAPELDHLAITRQLDGRRIAREYPERSLFLRKPTLQVKHGGGRVLEIDSPEYRVLAGWLRQGAPPVDKADVRLTELRLLPGDKLYRSGEHQRVLVQATFSDGHTEDVTHRALLRSTDPAVAQLTEQGEVTALNPGSTAVQAKYMDRLAVLRVTVPFPQKVDPVVYRLARSPIDRAVAHRLRELNLEPGPLCTDAEFIRRVYLDVLGTLPTAEEARQFLDSREPDKRARLIDAVLQRPEYASVWALKLADLFLMRKEHMGRKNTLMLHQWLTEQFLGNWPWDQIAADLIAASGSTRDKPQTLWYISRQAQRPNGRGWIRSAELTAEITAQVFLGTRIQCARCHNHPTEKYTQDDYYRFAAIFAQVNGEGKGDPVPALLTAKDKGEMRHPRSGELMLPQPLDHADLRVKEGEDRRQAFVQWLTGAGRDAFARNIANRVWARLFGMGIVEPVDDMRSTNPPRNERLLALLARELIDHRYDLKHLTRTILNSRTYQTSSIPTRTNRIDTQFFSRYPARRLPAEELMDAVAQATGVPDRFATYPLGTRAIELSDTELTSLTLDTFGRPTRVMPNDSERCNAPSMSQALELLNGESLQAKLKNPEGALAQLLQSGKPDTAVIDELFLRALARRPSAKEKADLLRLLPAAPSREDGMQDVFWALINSKEFLFNH
jgi:hypothetical protein